MCFDFVSEPSAMEFVRRVTGLTKAPCLRHGTYVMAMALPDEVSPTEDIAHLLRGSFTGVFHTMNSPR